MNKSSILDKIFGRKNGTATSEKEFHTSEEGRIKLSDWGYEEAGVHRGNPETLGNFLRLIKERHSKDEALNQEEQEKRRAFIRKDIDEKECRVDGLLKDAEQVNSTLIPAKLKQVEEHEQELAELKIRIKENRISSEYEPARFWMYCILFSFLTVFLFLFYTSAINAAFFRSIKETVAGADDSNIDLLINSIFDVNIFLAWKGQVIISLFGAFLFLAYGMVPHILMHGKNRFRLMWTTLSVLLALAIDCLIAYKIDSGIHELRLLMNIADGNWVWYKSVNFYLVLAFGFGGYMVWGLLYEAAITEKNKKNIEVRGKVLVDNLKQKIAKLNEEVEALKQRAANAQKDISRLQLEIRQMTKELERVLINPEELLRYYESFYNGWLRYVNQVPDKEQLRSECEDMFSGYRKDIMNLYR
jgi:hypothetical protein